jgi:hypothetical protein
LTDNSRLLGGAGGALLVIVGSILVGREGGLFLLGLLALLAGAGLVVRALLQLTETTTASAGSSQSQADIRQRRGLLNLEGIKKMSPMSQWIAGFLMGLIALLGLFLFSRAGDGMFALFGGLLFIFGIAVIAVFVHQATDYATPAGGSRQPRDSRHRAVQGRGTPIRRLTPSRRQILQDDRSRTAHLRPRPGFGTSLPGCPRAA